MLFPIFDELLASSILDLPLLEPTLFMLMVFSALPKIFRLFESVDNLLDPWSSTTESKAFLELLKFNELAEDEVNVPAIVETIGDWVEELFLTFAYKIYKLSILIWDSRSKVWVFKSVFSSWSSDILLTFAIESWICLFIWSH